MRRRKQLQQLFGVILSAKSGSLANSSLVATPTRDPRSATEGVAFAATLYFGFDSLCIPAPTCAIISAVDLCLSKVTIHTRRTV
jgi:hypothetical protein